MKKWLWRMVLPLTSLLLASVFFASVQAANTCGLRAGSAYRTASSPAVYYITDTCTKRPIKNPDVFFSHFASWKDVVMTTSANLAAVADDPLSFLPWGIRRELRDGSVVKTVNDSKVYLVSNGLQLYPIASEQIFNDLGLSWAWVEDVVPEVIQNRTVQSAIMSLDDYPSGLMFKYADSPDVYAIIHSAPGIQKMWIGDWSIVEKTYRPDHIVVFPSSRYIPNQPPMYATNPPTQTTTSSIVTSTLPVSDTTSALPGTVNTVVTLRNAVSSAKPGTVITLAPGTYDLSGSRITTAVDGTAEQPITIRAVAAGQVTIVTNGAEEAFQVSSPYYIFENLAVQVRGNGSYHAYKIDTNGHHAIIRGGSMLVYPGGENGVKGSGSGTAPYPDYVTIENTDISFTEPTTYSVAEGIDAVGVRGWIVRNNTIHNIKIAATGSVAWGVVFKGNSQDTVIEQNTFYDNDVAISIGGTTASQFFRDNNRDYEHRRATVRNNISVGTRDVALYIEKGNDTRVYNNTFINSFTSGGNSSIDVRYAASTADIRNNVLDKPIRGRDGGSHTASFDVITDGQFELSEFVNIAGHDLRPRSGTRLFQAIVDTGTPLQQVQVDKNGVARPAGINYDIGAYESSGQSLSLNTPTPTATVGVASLSLVRDDAHGLPGMYGGSWGQADFDRDGLTDIVVYGHYRTMYHSSDNPSGGNEELRLYKNISTIGGPIRFVLQQVVPDNNGNRGAYVVVGDFDSNGQKDFAVQTRNGGRGAGFLNNGNWSFTRREFPFENSSATFVMVATDVNQDGKDDLVFAGDGGVNAGLWYTWNGQNNIWESHQTNFTHRMNYGATMAAGDLTGDGYPEIAVGGNASISFGTHDCTGATPITSGARLQYGQANRNLGGSRGFDLQPLAIVGAFGYKVPEPTRHDLSSCHGMDNAQMLIRDLDGDSKNDVIIAGSSTGQDGPVGLNGQQYDFAVLFNDGTGENYAIWENTGPQNPNGGTNGGLGNLDFPSLAVGDLNGDKLPDILVEGHHRDFSVSQYPYIFEDIIFINNGNRTFTEVKLTNYLPVFGSIDSWPASLSFLSGRTRYVAEGGSMIADFNNDGKLDVLFSGAELPYHTNGVNAKDENILQTIKTYVLRNTK